MSLANISRDYPVDPDRPWVVPAEYLSACSQMNGAPLTWGEPTVSGAICRDCGQPEEEFYFNIIKCGAISVFVCGCEEET